jgi:hypothetical protein
LTNRPITAQLLRDKYEYRYYGMFRPTLSRLVLTADGVIGPRDETFQL